MFYVCVYVFKLKFGNVSCKSMEMNCLSEMLPAEELKARIRQIRPKILFPIEFCWDI